MRKWISVGRSWNLVGFAFAVCVGEPGCAVLRHTFEPSQGSVFVDVTSQPTGLMNCLNEASDRDVASSSRFVSGFDAPHEPVVMFVFGSNTTSEDCCVHVDASLRRFRTTIARLKRS